MVFRYNGQTTKPVATTWGEFKKAVEAQGVTDDTKLGYLDLYPSHGVTVRGIKSVEGKFLDASVE